MNRTSESSLINMIRTLKAESSFKDSLDCIKTFDANDLALLSIKSKQKKLKR